MYSLILRNKLLVLMTLVTVAFVISTIIVAVQKAELEDELRGLRMELENLQTTLPYPTTDSTTTTTTPEATTPGYRLPSNVVPEHYDLYLHPKMEEEVFVGHVTIDVIVSEEETDTIILHSHDLEIISVAVTDEETEDGNEEAVEFDIVPDDRQLLIIKRQSGTPFPLGNYTITIHFTGSLKNGIVGLYSSSIDATRNMTGSKFQPTYARQAFPCFDEPHLKATFKVTLVRPNAMIALSNMEESVDGDSSSTIEVLEDDAVAVTFDTSLRMSTYLAVFVVCDFAHSVVSIDVGGIGEDFDVRNFHQIGEEAKIEFADNITKYSMEHFIRYFEIEYPLPKLDQIAIPDYVSGATEHWGLVTYRETSFLIDPETSSSVNRRSVATTIAHELAHMWAGNLVTMKWWDETWLNEGFATYLSYTCLEDIRPDWGIMQGFGVRQLHTVLNLDATHASHPIIEEVNTPDEITAIFDGITYNKGAALLRMIDNFMGNNQFRLGVKEYMEEFRLGSTVTADLVDSLETRFMEVYPDSGLNLTHITATWTEQMGFPVITIDPLQPVGDLNNYRLTQKRFLADPSTSNDGTPSPFDYRWTIPITYKTNLGEDFIWFNDGDDEETLTIQGDVDWLILNRDQIGFFRINYAEPMWINLIDSLNVPERMALFSASERAMLINDAFILADAGETNYSTPLRLVNYLRNERAWAPWSAAISRFNVMQRRLQYSIGYTHIRALFTDLVTNVYNEIGWEPTGEEDEDEHDVYLENKILRSDILSFACAVGHAEARRQVASRFSDWLVTPTNLNPDIKSTIYTYGIQGTGESEWWELWDLYNEETDAQEKARLIAALSSTSDVSLLRILLDLSWEDNYVRGQDQVSLIINVANNPSGTAVAWEYVREHWDRLVARHDLNSRVLGNMIPSITSSFSTQTQLDDMESFFARRPEAGAGASARDQALENLRINIAWRQQHQDYVIALLAPAPEPASV